MDKLESDLESFVRICHLHEKVDMLEYALAEKDREIAKWSEIVSLLTGTEHKFLKEAEKGKIAYHALMAKAVRFAECVERDPIADYDDGELATKFLTSPEVRKWREQQEGL